MKALFRLLQLLATLLVGGLHPAAHAQGSFGFEAVARLAQERAQAPYAAPSSALPAQLQGLDYDGLRDIRFRPERSLWRDTALPFEAQFFHRGLYQREPVRLHRVPDTPEFLYPAYVVYAAGAEPPALHEALEGLREMAGELPPPGSPSGGYPEKA